MTISQLRQLYFNLNELQNKTIHKDNINSKFSKFRGYDLELNDCIVLENNDVKIELYITLLGNHTFKVNGWEVFIK